MNGLFAVFRGEFRRMFTLRPAFSVLIAAVLVYAVFYPQPYLNEALREVPIALVDLDGTVSSREFARRIEATSDVAVAMVLPDLVNAERQVFARTIFGILLIPKDFERDLLHGRSAPVALYADASYFLMYQRIAGGVSGVARSFGAEVETARLIEVGLDPAQAAAAADPMPLTAVPLFNPQGGYATYLLPAALVLILQQTLLIGTGLLGTSPGADLRPRGLSPGAAAAALPGPPLTVVAGKLLAYLALEAAIVPFYLVVLPYFYGLPRLGSLLAILAVSVPFVLSVGALGLVVATIFRTPLAVQLATAAIGLPFFFVAGFSWPSEAMPAGIRFVALLVPSTSAIDALVRVGQLGAPVSGVRSQVLILCGLAVLYGCLAVVQEARKSRPGLA